MKVGLIAEQAEGHEELGQPWGCLGSDPDRPLAEKGLAHTQSGEAEGEEGGGEEGEGGARPTVGVSVL